MKEKKKGEKKLGMAILGRVFRKFSPFTILHIHVCCELEALSPLEGGQGGDRVVRPFLIRVEVDSRVCVLCVRKVQRVNAGYLQKTIRTFKRRAEWH